MWLPYQDALRIAVVLVVAVVVTSNVRNRWVRGTRTFAKESVHVLVLYTIWQYARSRAITKTAGAIEHARSLYKFEQALHLPSEVSVQNMFLHRRLPMQFLNIYYGGAHVPAMGILLVWLFFRYRDRYPAVRTTTALTIAGCLSIQMIPVAPPRFLPDLGFVDVALVYNQSVYGTGGSGVSNQLAAMPSLHVAWSVIVALVVIRVSRSPRRWLVVLHPVLTVVAITATANHWWLDGVVSVAVLGVAVVVRRSGARLRARLLRRWHWRHVDEPTPVDDDREEAGERQLARP